MQFDEHVCDISHNLNRHGASRGPSAIVELLEPFWYQLTQVILEKRPLTGVVVVVV